MEIPNDDYYQNMLRTLDAPPKKKKKSKMMDASGVKYDKSSPFYYLHNSRALSALEAQIEAEKAIEVSQQQAAREEERARFLSEKSAKAKRTTSNKNVIQQIMSMKITTTSMKQRELEEALLRPYRKDPRNVTHLLEHCEEIVRERNREAEEARQAIYPKTDKVSIPLTLEERLESARQRRKEIEHEQLQRYEESIRSRTAHDVVQNTKTHTDRMKTWLTLSRFFFGLKKMGDHVLDIRALKAQDKAKWNACVRIQRLWRKRRGIRDQYRRHQIRSMNSFKKRLGLKPDDHRIDTYKSRVSSADTLVHFLRETRTKALMRRMFRVVKYLQRVARSLKAVETARLQLLASCVEKCMMPFAAHVAIVANNRGLDLQNLSHYESNQLRAQSHLTKAYRVIAAMQTAEFHAQLRRHVAKLGDFQRDFIVTSKVWTERQDIKKRLLLKLLTRKRRAFLKDLQKPSPMTYQMPAMGLDEIQAFILGGPDPLTPRIETFEAKHQEWYEEKHRPKTPFRCRDPQQREQFVQPRFLLLTYLQPSDLIFFFAEFSSLLREEKRQQAAAIKAAAMANIEAGLGMMRTFSNDKNDESNGGRAIEFGSPSRMGGGRWNPNSSSGGGGGFDPGSSSRSFASSSARYGGGGIDFSGSQSQSFRGSSSRHGQRRSSTQHGGGGGGGGGGGMDASSSRLGAAPFNRRSSTSGGGFESSSMMQQSSHHPRHGPSPPPSAKVAFAAPPLDRKKSVSMQHSHRRVV